MRWQTENSGAKKKEMPWSDKKSEEEVDSSNSMRDEIMEGYPRMQPPPHAPIAWQSSKAISAAPTLDPLHKDLCGPMQFFVLGALSPVPLGW